MNYKDKRWIKTRERILRRDRYECKECKRFGKTTLANTVHHVNAVEDKPNLKYNTSNMISLCSLCHNKMHDRVTNKLTGTGKLWRDKTRV